MTTMAFADSVSVEQGYMAFSSLVSFNPSLVMTLFLEGILSALLCFVQSLEESLVPNLEASTFIQQDYLLSPVQNYPAFITTCTLLIQEYGVKIQNPCALIEASSSQISDVEKVEIVLACLPPEYDDMLMLASFLSETLSFQRLVDVLLEYETHQLRVVHELPLYTNLVEFVPSPLVVDSLHGGRPPKGSRGRGFQTHV
ncbi:hypothetical protein J1N35_015169 [Gossypium stocksii]|uniref:Uncharacterized protein n=1 Tax=Gossypium stocksii TaxID=47602 RepID=A0A9D3VWR1_9ROSI|nr:hypothetical protein J1N35_015169 [Gossypium stocksii]